MARNSTVNRGLLYGIAAYALWGFFPIYWKLLQEVPPAEILIHRILWSLVFLVVLLSLQKKWQWVRIVWGRPRILLILIAAACLLAVNWFTYIWGVNNGFIVETSLGYFINPLVNVLLGVLILRERLRTMQWVAVGIAATGVMYLAIGYGSLPWIALTLAFSFGFYGLLKKSQPLAAAQSLAGEMIALSLPAFLFFASLFIRGEAAFGSGSIQTDLLLVLSGVVTAAPLIFFAAAAQQIPLSSLGLLQYIAPTLQFLIGVLIYREPFPVTRLIGFVIIWIALSLYLLDNVIHIRSHRRVEPQATQTPSS
jgi:chloramphenicol-sensitive protein RarD